MIKIKRTAIVALLASGLAMSSMAQASLVDNGNGLIYDSDLNITWLQDFSYPKTSGYSSDGRLLFLSGAEQWAAALKFDGLTGWRLPTINVLDNIFSYSGTDWGYNGTTNNNEFAHLWYVTLGNKSVYDMHGVAQAPIVNTGPFINMIANYYFLSNANGSVYPSKEGWVFDAGIGAEGLGSGGWGYAIAVHSGDVFAVTPVHEPSIILLFCSSLGLLALTRRRKYQNIQPKYC